MTNKIVTLKGANVAKRSGLGSYDINKKFAFFNSKKSHEGLRRKTNGRTCPVNLGPRILKIVVFGARRRLLHPHFNFRL